MIGTSVTFARDFAFARYGALVVAARAGAPIPGPSGTPLPEVKLCGYVEDSSATDHIPRRGGSDRVCNSVADCTGTTPKKCQYLGTAELVECNVCLPAAWKVRLPADPSSAPDCDPPQIPAALDGAMWDLATNPEEDELLDLKQKFPDVWCALKKKIYDWNHCGDSLTTACE
jgi:hypothetical protein